MKVKYEGADVLFVPTENGPLAAIACTEKAEITLYNWAVKYLINTGVEIGTLRTVFGLTFYAFKEPEQKALKDFVREKNLDTYYGHV
jgi:hypothetical protein